MTGWNGLYSVKQYKSHGGATIDEAQQHMQETRAKLSKYELRDICNGDETVYYWRKIEGKARINGFFGVNNLRVLVRNSDQQNEAESNTPLKGVGIFEDFVFL